MRRYYREPDAMINPLTFPKPSAYEVAREHYLALGLDLEKDMADYKENGFVVIRPTVLAMGKAIWKDGRRGWFIRYACGNMLELLTCFPVPLSFVAFCRDNDAVMRVCDWKRFLRLAAARRPRSRKIAAKGDSTWAVAVPVTQH